MRYKLQRGGLAFLQGQPVTEEWATLNARVSGSSQEVCGVSGGHFAQCLSEHGPFCPWCSALVSTAPSVPICTFHLRGKKEDTGNQYPLCHHGPWGFLWDRHKASHTVPDRGHQQCFHLALQALSLLLQLGNGGPRKQIEQWFPLESP